MMKAADDLQEPRVFGFDVVDDTGIGKVMEMEKVRGRPQKVKFGALKKYGSFLIDKPYFLAIAGVAGVGMAFKWFYDYNKGHRGSLRKTMQFTGLFGNKIKSVKIKRLGNQRDV